MPRRPSLVGGQSPEFRGISYSRGLGKSWHSRCRVRCVVRKGDRTLISVVILLNLADHQPSCDCALGEAPDSKWSCRACGRGLGFRV